MTSNKIVIKLLASKKVKVRLFAKPSFKFNSRNWVAKVVKKRPLAMFGSKIIDSSEEGIDCNWNYKEDLNQIPPETSYPT
jgi:hypothetical protein